MQAGWLVLTLTSLWVFGCGLWWLYAYAQNPPLWLVRAAHEMGITVGVVFALNAFVLLVIYSSFFLVAQLIVLRRGHERFALFAAVVLLCFGTANALPLFPEIQLVINAPPLYFGIPLYIVNMLGYCLGAAFVITYPDGHFVPRWTFGVAAFSFLFALGWTTYPQFFIAAQGGWLVFVILSQVFISFAILYAQIWRYRNYLTPLQKQQVKWFIYGLALTVVIVIGYSPLTFRLANTDQVPAQVLWFNFLFLMLWVSIAALPLAIGIAILRYRLWDIDIIIRKTVTYVLVIALLAIVYFGSVILLQQLFAALANAQGNEIITVLSTLAIAALFIPLRNRIQRTIDKRFYRKKYDAQTVLHDFAMTVRDETDLDKLTNELLNVVNETMQPKKASVWLKKSEPEVKR